MRVNVISDLHLDFADLELPGGEVLIISGDAMEAKRLKKDMYNPDMVMLEHERKDQRPDRFYRFFEEECRKYKDVIYVMGNHEHYGYNVSHTYDKINNYLPDNFQLMAPPGKVLPMWATAWLCLRDCLRSTWTPEKALPSTWCYCLMEFDFLNLRAGGIGPMKYLIKLGRCIRSIPFPVHHRR